MLFEDLYFVENFEELLVSDHPSYKAAGHPWCKTQPERLQVPSWNWNRTMSQRGKQEATVSVPAKDPKRSEKDEEDQKAAQEPSESGKPNESGKSKKGKKDEAEMSAEDEALKSKLDELVKSVLDADYAKVGQAALASLKNEIRSATASMTSVPKPLKFLKEHYATIKAFYTKLSADSASEAAMLRAYSDLMSLLAMTMEDPQTRLCLRYRLESDIDGMTEWGTQYLKHVAAEIRIEMERRLAAEQDAEKTAGTRCSRNVPVPVSAQNRSQSCVWFQT